jgi:hypothetical protein
LNGHVDVPREAIGFEAFIVNGRYYGYFGIGPALLRIPLLLIFEHMDGLWSRAMMMLACTLSLICVYRLLLALRANNAPPARWQRLLDSLFVICAGIGSTNVFLVARSFTFHEAIMWGSTFALLFTCALVNYFRSGNTLSLVAAGAFTFMSFHCRATVGAGTLLALCVVAVVLAWRGFAKNEVARATLGFTPVAKPMQHALIAVTAIVLTLGTYFALNYAKFGTLSALPLQYYNLYVQAPTRMQVTSATQIHIENLPTGIATYCGWRGARFDRHFPWIYLSREPTLVGSPAIDVVEGFSTFPVSMPALTVLAFIGCVPLLRGASEAIRRFRLPAITLLLGGGISLMTVGITERYLHDLYPALMIFAAIGILAFGSGKYLPAKTALIALLTLISVACNCAFALVHQRVARWGVPAAKRAEFDRLQQRIDSFF